NVIMMIFSFFPRIASISKVDPMFLISNAVGVGGKIVGIVLGGGDTVFSVVFG
ncbi:MAG: hypothetical protein ACI9E1_001791, partial [Cryomorphaceae bacterium]